MNHFEMQRELLKAKVGQPRSGAQRYGAAMYFYREKLMSAEMLEIYRSCSKFDDEDPIDVARYEGIQIPPLLRPKATV